jgi:hypothetical protein
MPATDRTDLVRRCFAAFAADRPEVVEAAVTEGFTFSSPPDPLLDREGFFARCWPNAGRIAGFSIVRLIEDGDEVVVTYEADRGDGGRFRNTEVFTFAGDRIDRQEVYFGWDLAA